MQSPRCHRRELLRCVSSGRVGYEINFQQDGNLDWVQGLSSEERERPESHLQKIAAQFRANYTESLQCLIDRAKMENHRVAIIIFGLANIDTYLEGRQNAEMLHAENPKYPHLNSGPRTLSL